MSEATHAQREVKILHKDEHHHHFWIENETLFESYTTIRGMRYRFRLDVPGMPDEEWCSVACINYIEKQYCNP